MKKIITMLLLLTMVIGAVPVYAAEGDTPSVQAKDSVENAISKGYVPAHLQSKYQSPITREEFSELFVTAVFTEVDKDYQKSDSVDKKYMDLGDKFTVDSFLNKVTTTEKFVDTDNKYVKVANMLGMVNGVGEGKFNPNGLITREQVAIMFVNYFQTITGPGFIKGTREFKGETIPGQKDPKITQMGHFDTKGNFTREQAIMVVSRLGSGEGNKDILGNLVLRGYKSQRGYWLCRVLDSKR